MTKKLSFLLLVLLFFVTGCGNSLSTAGNIVTPARHSVPLAGKWMITRDVSPESSSSQAQPTPVGQTAQFSEDAALIAGQVWLKPSYKIKQVNASDYVLSKYINLPNNLIDYSQTVAVITVSTADNFVGEFMKLNDQLALAFLQNKILYLNKVGPVDFDLAGLSAANNPNPGQPNKSSPSGVLLGLRSPVETSGQGDRPDDRHPEYTYRTLWIALEHDKLHPVLASPDIFFPRRNGFWKLKVRRIQAENKTEDKLIAYDVTTTDLEKEPLTLDSVHWQDKDGFLARAVDYVGNDYVAVENSGSGELPDNGQVWTDNRLMILPVDSLASQAGIRLSDLADKNGVAAFTKARNQAIQSLTREDAHVRDIGDPEQNFGLIRRNGHWFLRGRVDSQRNGKPSYTDFSVNLLPPSKLISFDTLYLSWQAIKDRVPDAIDAYTSPNRNLALLLTRSKLYIYAIKEGRLESEPLFQIALNQGESVVMAEWATAAYVDNWEKSFSLSGAKELRVRA